MRFVQKLAIAFCAVALVATCSATARAQDQDWGNWSNGEVPPPPPPATAPQPPPAPAPAPAPAPPAPQDEAPAAVEIALADSGFDADANRFGAEVRLGVAGHIEMIEEDELSMKSGPSPGFGLFWEKATDGVVAPGLFVGAQFITASFGYFEEYAADIGTELQIDPRLRFYLVQQGWWRPYLQAAFGLSLGIPSEWIREETPIGIGFNTSGMLGLLMIPKGTDVGFFFAGGVEWTAQWGVGDVDEGAYQRQFVFSMGIEG